MRSLLPYMAIIMIYLMTPGAGEFAENIVHLAINGHTAHALDDAAHQSEGDEHGCSGPFHFCQCHTSTPFTITMQVTDMDSALMLLQSFRWRAEEVISDGFLLDVFRPPIA